MRRSRALLLCGLVAACVAPACIEVPGAPIEATGLKLSIRTRAKEVALGQSFPLTVVRVWEKDLEPEQWDDSALTPLVLRLERSAVREDPLRKEEIRQYLAYAYALDEVRLEPIPFRATPRAGGAERVVYSRPQVIRVQTLLDPADPGEVEYPGGPLRRPVPWLPIAAGGVLVAAALVLQRRRSRAEAAPDAPATQSPAPAPAPAHVDALERLGRLRAARPADPDALQTYYAEAADIVRSYVQRRCDVEAPEKTNEELIALQPVTEHITSTHRSDLAALLAHCDHVRFGRYAPPPPERAAQLDAAERFVRSTAAGDVA